MTGDLNTLMMGATFFLHGHGSRRVGETHREDSRAKSDWHGLVNSPGPGEGNSDWSPIRVCVSVNPSQRSLVEPQAVMGGDGAGGGLLPEGTLLFDQDAHSRQDCDNEDEGDQSHDHNPYSTFCRGARCVKRNSIATYNNGEGGLKGRTKC